MSTQVEQVLGDVLEGLLTCLCGALVDTPGGTPCFCGMVGGVQAIADHCSCDAGNKCGQAWVRLDRIYPYDTSVITPARTPSCTSPLAAVVEVGVYRCIPTTHADGTAPTVLEQTNQVLGQVADAGAMLAAIKCCTAITTRSHVLGSYVPRDSGDCGGGVVTVTVALSAGVRPMERGGVRRGTPGP
jgi:hypothetical protein